MVKPYGNIDLVINIMAFLADAKRRSGGFRAFPARFPATPAIRLKSCMQGVDQKQLLGSGRSRGKFFP